MKRSRFALYALVLVLLCWTTALGQPGLTHAVPAAIEPGKTTDVTFFGSNLEGVARFWTSFPAKVQLAPGIDKNGTEAGKVTYRIKLADDAPVGIGAVRVATPKGASSLMLFMVDDLPSAVDNGANHSPTEAQEITLPVAVDGKYEAASFNYYKFTAEAGQRVSIETVARRLGSPLDPVIRLLDADGRELAYNDDDTSIGADSRLAYQFDAGGDYLIELRDIRYEGGDNHRYRLRVGQFPLISVPYPLGGQLGSEAEFSFIGPLVDGLEAQNILVPDHVVGDLIDLAVKYEGGAGSGLARAITSRLPERIEQEPNNQPDSATSIALPCAVSGRFESDKDRDYYEFEAKKGQAFTFTGLTRRLGSPSDLFMRLYKYDGSQVAEVDDTNMAEGKLGYTFPEDGTYRLMVEDLHLRGGPEHAYRVEIALTEKGFTLAVATDKITAPSDGSFATKVTCARQGYDGPIMLSLEGAGEDVQLERNIIAKGQKETNLLVTVPRQLKQGELFSTKLVGKATIDGKEVAVVASTSEALKKLWPQTLYWPPVLEGSIGLGIGPESPPLFALGVGAPVVTFPRLVGQAEFSVVALRIEKEYVAPLTLRVEGLPAGVSAEIKPVDKGQREYTVVLKGPTDLAEGRQTIRIVAFGEHKSRAQKVVLTSVPFQVITPVSVAIAPSGPIVAGKTQTVKVSVSRTPPAGGGDRPAIMLKWKNLPPGIFGPETVVLPAERDRVEVQLQLTAAADAKAGTYKDLTVVATTKVNGQDVTVESQPATLETEGS